MATLSEDDQYNLMDMPEGKADLSKVFPMGFTFCALLVILPVEVKAFDVAFDYDWTYFCGHLAAVLCFLPPVFVGIALAGLIICGRPTRPVLFTGVVPPGVIILVLALIFFQRGNSIGNRLAYGVCSTRSRGLEESWNRANAFFTGCLRNHTGAYPILTIEECPHYRQNEDAMWLYLRSLEERYTCGGWCKQRTPLWGYQINDPEVSCSQTVSDLMMNKYHKLGLQLLLYMVVLMVLGGSFVTFTGSKKIKHTLFEGWL